MFKRINPNPKNKEVGDCTVRAIALAEDRLWDDVFADLCEEAFKQADMPSSNKVWGQYLLNKGYYVEPCQPLCGDGCSIKEFTRIHPLGTYIVATGSHVVCVRNGDYLDSWDSGEKAPSYYFYKD